MNGVVLTLVSRTDVAGAASETDRLREQLEAERSARHEAERKLFAKGEELAALTTTARKGVEDNRSTVRFLNAVMDSMPAGLCLTDIQGKLRMANPPAREMLKIASDCVQGADLQAYLPQVSIKSLRAGRPIGVELQRSDGTGFPAEVVISPLLQGINSSLVWLISDISERKAAEESRKKLESELREAHKMEALGVLSAGIAHEINTPLQFARDNLTFLNEAFSAFRGALEKARPTLGEELAEATWRDFDIDFHATEGPKAIGDTVDGLHRVAEIVRAIKEFAHPSGAVTQANDLNKIVQNAVMVSRNQWKYVANVVTDLADGLPMVECCGGEIGQVLVNLFSNAADAIAELKQSGKGEIRVATRLANDRVEIVVADNGPGIPGAIMPRVFDPFFTTKEPGKGSGQGLAICHTIVCRSHKGQITAEDNQPRGALFRVLLPLRSGDPT